MVTFHYFSERDVTILKEQVDVKGWLEPHFGRTLHNHLQPRGYLFKAAQDGEVVQYYRRMSFSVNQNKAWTELVPFMATTPDAEDVPLVSL